MVLYYIYRLLTLVVPFIPSSVGYWICDRIADLLYLFAGTTRRNIEFNQRHVLGANAPADEVRRVVRGVFRTLVKNYYDQFRLWKLTDDELRDFADLVGIEYLDEALSHGKGVLLVTAHFGSPEVTAQALAVRGYDITSPVEHIQPEALFQLMTSLRASHGLHIVPVEKPLNLLKALKRGGIVGIVSDRDITNSGICVPFFGEPTRMPDGAVQLSLRTGAPIVVAYSYRLPDNRFRAVGFPPIYLKKTGDKTADVERGVRQIVALMEQFIREHPDQWFVTVPMWGDACREQSTSEASA